MKDKINLSTAILININIMIGAGIFMNPAPLTKFVSAFSFSSYLFSGLLLLPIVLTIGKLAQIEPVAGGLYVYGKKSFGNFIGFWSGWSYFLGKATSAALLCNTFIIFFQNKIIILQKIPTLILNFLLIFFLIFINIIGIKIGGNIQYFFSAAKLIPILFVIFGSLSIFKPELFIFTYHNFNNLFSTLPIAIYALLSFEIITSIGHMLKNPKKNIHKTILYSFLIVTGIASIFQFSIFGALGNNVVNFNIPILFLGSKLFLTSNIIPAIINSFVFISIIGGAFGSLSSNAWNIYALAKDKQLPFSKLFMKINKNEVPIFCLIFEGLIAFLLLAITQNQITLQNMTVWGIVTAYFVSSLALLKKSMKKNFWEKILPIFSILSSIYIFGICTNNIIKFGISISFIIIFLSGIFFAGKKIFNKYI